MKPRADFTAYRQAIEALIPRAAKVATDEIRRKKLLSKNTDESTWTRRWNKAFHEAMDRLAAENGLRRQSWQASPIGRTSEAQPPPPTERLTASTAEA